MRRDWWLWMTAGCRLYGADGSAGGSGGAGGDGTAGGQGAAGGAAGGSGGGAAGGEGDEKSVEGLKSALVKEREANKEAKRVILEQKKTLEEHGRMLDDLKKSAGNAEESNKKLGEAQGKLAAYETREKRLGLLDAASKKAAEGGLELDVEKARRNIDRVKGEKDEDLVADMVEMFGRPKAAAAGGSGGGNGNGNGAAGGRAFTGQPAQGSTGGGTSKTYTTKELADLSRSNPEAYEAAIAETRKDNPFFKPRG